MIRVIVLVLNDAIEKLGKARTEEKEENLKENKKETLTQLKRGMEKKRR